MSLRLVLSIPPPTPPTPAPAIIFLLFLRHSSSRTACGTVWCITKSGSRREVVDCPWRSAAARQRANSPCLPLFSSLPILRERETSARAPREYLILCLIFGVARRKFRVDARLPGLYDSPLDVLSYIAQANPRVRLSRSLLFIYIFRYCIYISSEYFSHFGTLPIFFVLSLSNTQSHS